MSRPLSDIEAQSLLRDVSRKTNAHEVVNGPFVPKWAQYLLLAVVIGIGAMSGVHMEGRYFSAVLGGLIGGVAGLALEMWGIKRRMEAMLVLLKAQEPHDTTADNRTTAAGLPSAVSGATGPHLD